MDNFRGDLVKKRVISIVVALALIVTSLLCFGVSNAFGATSGDCSESGSRVKWSYDASTTTLTFTGTGAIKNSYIASTVPWKSVKADVTTVVVNEGITQIGRVCFYEFSALTSVSLPSTLTSIKGGSLNYGAFRECTALEKITLPESLTEIDDMAFRGCISLKSITIPDSVTTLGTGVFRDCTNLQTVKFGTGLTSTGTETFLDAGVKNITFSSTITKVGNYSFKNCKVISVEFPEKISTIGVRAFANNYFLQDVTVNNANTLFDGVSIAEEDPFYGSTQVSNQQVIFKGHKGSTTEVFVTDHPNSSYVFESIDACDHTSTHEVITLQPTCTEKGTTTQVCDECSFVVSTAELPAAGHSWVVDETLDQSAENGHIITNSTCSSCGEQKQEIEHVGWVQGFYDYSNTSTCEKAGIETYHCTFDGCTQRDKITPVLASHKVSEYTVTKEPTCTEKGEQQGVCSVCGITVTQEIAALGHTFETTNIDDQTAVDGHNYETNTCTRCGYEETSPVHVEWLEGYYTSVTRESSSCSRPGVSLDTCTICSKTRLAEIPATGEHVWYETSRREPTCTADGSISYACENCTATKTEKIEKLGHQLVLDETNSVAPTCTTAGYNIWKCSVCGSSQTDVLNATGHTPDELNYTIIADADCVNDGSATSICTICGEEFEITLAALGHNYEDVVTPIEDKPGHSLVVQTCTRCGSKGEQSTRHDEWMDGYYSTKVVTEGSCTVARVTQDTCDLCGTTRTNTQTAPGHKYSFTGLNGNGRLTYLCSVCNGTTTASPAAVKASWSSVYINTKPEDTRLGYQFDVVNDGIINAKDYSYLSRLNK